MRDLGDPLPGDGDGADTTALAARIERLASRAQAAFMPVATGSQEPLQALLGADTAPLLRALQDMHHAVEDAQCREQLPRWLRWLGPTRRSGLRFQSDCREAMASPQRICERTRRLAHGDEARAAASGTDLDQLLDAADRLDAATAQAQSLLAALWESLRPQRPDPADRRTLATLRARLAEVDRRRELLQRLDLACTGARDLVRLGRAVLAGRAEMLRLVDRRFVRASDDWCARIEPLLRDGVQPAQLLAGSRDATASRRGLLLALDQLRAVCTRLQIDEQALGHALAQWRVQLEGLHPPGPGGQIGAPGEPLGNSGR